MLLDLDGVVRHFDKSEVPRLEAEHQLPPGSLRTAAFAEELLDLAVTGKITRTEWIHRVGEAVGSTEAAESWLAPMKRGRVDDRMIEIVRGLRQRGVLVAILTNGTDTAVQEVAALGIADEFDAIFSTALIGFAKPDRRAFEHVCQAMDVAPADVFFTDDTESKLSGAIEIGMTAKLFEGVEQFAAHLDEFVTTDT